MDSLVSYDVTDGVATLVMDDGKVNVLSLPMLAAINRALDRAEADGAAVVLSGRPGVFSAGFDLGTLRGGGPDAAAMGRAGFALASRLLSCPYPVVAACTGHAIAMGAFLLCSADYRVGATGTYKLTANEVAIGFPLPAVAVAILRGRLTPSALNRAATLAEVFTPENAVENGFLDRVVTLDSVLAVAQELARTLTSLDQAAHATTKLTVRRSTLDILASDLATDRPIIEGVGRTTDAGDLGASVASHG
jgi:enoyl-CoA hydratase